MVARPGSAGRHDFLRGPIANSLSADLAAYASAVHAYDMRTYRYQRDGELLPTIEE